VIGSDQPLCDLLDALQCSAAGRVIVASFVISPGAGVRPRPRSVGIGGGHVDGWHGDRRLRVAKGLDAAGAQMQR